MRMIETLYKSKSPEVQVHAHQHFELTMGEETINDQLVYFVRETHCWFDSAKKNTIRVQYTLSPRGGFLTIAEAHVRYQAQKLFRAKAGYFHCYAPRFESSQKFRYTKVEIPEDPIQVEKDPTR